MAKRILNEQQIIDVVWGATLMGGGGGGSFPPALELLEKFKHVYPDKPVEIEMIEAADMEPGAYAGVTASMGAPTAIRNKDFFAITTNAFKALQEMAAKLDKPRNVKYSYGVELGGFNTFVPILTSLLNNIPFLDADGAGRAVPALNTLLLHINGCDTSPLAMADDHNNCLTITTESPRDAEMAEEICRNLCVAFGMQAGVAGWMVTKEEILEKLPCGTVTLCEKIGHVLRRCVNTELNAFDELTKEKTIACKCLTAGKVVQTENVCEKGFDYGKIHIQGDNGKWTIFYQNENLMVAHDGKPYMTMPDIICCYDKATGMPLTNADIEEGMELVVGAMRVSEKWWLNPDMFKMWEPLLNRVGYSGPSIPYNK